MGGAVLLVGDHHEPMERSSRTVKGGPTTTWNDRARIAEHRALSPAQRLRLTIEASRAALRFAHGARRSER